MSFLLAQETKLYRYFVRKRSCSIYSEGQSMVPSLMPSITSWGSIPSTVQPTAWAVPSTSFMVPENSLAMDLGAIILAAAMMSSIVMLPLCWMFFTFLRSLGGSFKALMTRAAADGTTEQVACLFWILSCTVTFKPFQSPVALAMSSPIFLGDRPRGPTLGAREEVAPTSPPTALR